jgi:ribonuclease D
LVLKERGLLALAQEDFYRISMVNGRAPEDKADDCWRVSGAYDLPHQKAAVLQELCRYRDKIARATNRPLFKVLNDSTLLAIANECPTDLNSLKRIPGMTRGQIDRHGKALLAAVQRGLHAKPVSPPRVPRPSEEFLERVEALRNWRKAAAQEMGVKSDVVLPRDLLINLAEQNPRNTQELEPLMNSVPWRFEHFGGQILSVLKEGRF